jgi:hypothetical protein
MNSTDSNATHRHILTDLLRHDPAPKELEITILPFPLDYNDNEDNDTGTATNQSSFMKEGIHLGIHAPHVPKLAREFRKEYYTCRSTRAIIKTETDTERGLDPDPKQLMDCISCLLLLCPDHATAWADRRRLLISQENQILESSTLQSRLFTFWEAEIGYLNMLYTQHSKAPNAWAHRRWVCRQIIKSFTKTNHDHDSVFEGLIDNDIDISDKLLSWATCEIAVCTVIAEKYPKNYYAWTHRSFITRTLASLIQDEHEHEHEHDVSVWNCNDDIRALLQAEVDSIEPWLSRHVSDHSAAHYGGEVLSLWFTTVTVGKNNDNANDGNDCIQWKVDIIKEKLKGSEILIKKFPSHEVIWIWRRICSRVFVEYASAESIVSFIRQEILKSTSTFESALKVDADAASTCMDETMKQQHHSLTHVLWILKYTYAYAKFTNVEKALIREELSALERQMVQIQLSKDDLSIRHIWDLIVVCVDR